MTDRLNDLEASLARNPLLTPEEVSQYAAQVSTAWRLTQLGLKVDGVPFDLRPYPFLWDVYDDEESTDETIMKGAQLGFTTLQVLRVIDRAERIYKRGVLYLFPTKDDVTDFSKTRFQRILDDNPVLGGRVKGTDAANVKQVGDCFVYFRGAKARGGVKSIPVDCIVYDEFDEMTEAMVALADERISGSKIGHIMRLSTPTFPETRIHSEYLATNRMRWLIKCRGCNRYAALEDDFPDCLVEKNGEVLRACVKCGTELRVIDGVWVAERPSVKRMGRHVSQLCSPTVNVAKILDSWKDPRIVMREFYNSKLGLPYADIQEALDDAACLACCGNMARRLAHDGPSWAGVDIGKRVVHYIAGSRKNDRQLRVHAFHELDDDSLTFQDVRDLNKRYNVVAGVMDAGAETRAVRNFVRDEPGWWGCMYTEQRQSGGYQWDMSERIVTVNRTESLDDSHRMIVSQSVEFPRADDKFRERVIPQLKNLVRMVDEKDERTGEKRATWVRKGAKNDHFRHAWNLGVVAAADCPIESLARRSRGRAPRGEGGTWMSS